MSRSMNIRSEIKCMSGEMEQVKNALNIAVNMLDELLDDAKDKFQSKAEMKEHVYDHLTGSVMEWFLGEVEDIFAYWFDEMKDSIEKEMNRRIDEICNPEQK